METTNTIPHGTAETRVAKVDAVGGLVQGQRCICTVRLSDGATLRVHTATLEEIQRAGVQLGGVMAYDVDYAGNRYNPRAATPEQAHAFRSRRG
jgi:hypothetical protein